MDGAREGYALIRIRNFLRDRTLEGLQGTDLKTGHVPFLLTVLAEPGVSLTELSRRTGLDKSTVARNVQQLVDLGYVERVGDPRRSNTVYLTERGETAAKELAERDAEATRDLLSRLEPGDEEDLERILRRIMDRVEDAGY